MTEIIEVDHGQVKRTYYLVKAWEFIEHKNVNGIYSPDFSTPEEAKKFLEINKDNLPEGASIYEVKDFI